MDPKTFSLERIEKFLQPEFIHLTLAAVVLSWLIYKILLREVSEERHRNLRGLFKNLYVHFLVGAALFSLYTMAHTLNFQNKAFERPAMYLGYLTFLWGLIIIVKASRILVFEYLFIGHMRVPVPLLIVNLFTLILCFGLGLYVATELFEMKLTPLLATSAVFSLVVGLALQDTLGNLFAGVSMQFDKPYLIDDWIEVSTGTQKWVGQVKEISWRATLLQGFAEEFITIPNRIMTQSQIANFNTRNGPIIRSQMFRMSYDVDVKKIKEMLVNSIDDVEGVRKYPGAFVLITEVADSWLIFKLIYYIDDYGSQYSIGDRVVSRVAQVFQMNGVKCAVPRMEIEKSA